MSDRLILCLRLIRHVLRRFFGENFDQTAASLAFTTLLSLVPLVAVILGVVSAMPSFLQVVDRLEDVARNLLPPHSANLIVERVLEFSLKALNVTLVGLLVLSVTVFTLLHTVEHAFNTAWKSPPRRSWWRRLILYSTLIAIWPITVTYVVGAISYAVSLSVGLTDGLPIKQIWLHGLLSRVTNMLVTALFFGALYRVFPSARVRLSDALLGGLFASFCLLLMQKGFVLYLSYFPSIRLVYGAFATLPIFLLWLYLSWAMVLIGALVTATIPEFRDGLRNGDSAPQVSNGAGEMP